MKVNFEAPQRLRAFDLIEGVMHYDFQYIFLKSESEDIQSGMIYNSDRHKHDFSVFPPEQYISEHRFVVMEWVHAVDDMNMPIYEGDIIDVKNEISGEEIRCVVFWGYKGSAICWDINKISENNKLCQYVYLDKKHTTYSVIGNIYDNKDIVSHLYDLKILDIFYDIE